MGRWGDGEMGRFGRWRGGGVGRFGRWEGGEVGRWGDGDMRAGKRGMGGERVIIVTNKQRNLREK